MWLSLWAPSLVGGGCSLPLVGCGVGCSSPLVGACLGHLLPLVGGRVGCSSPLVRGWCWALVAIGAIGGWCVVVVTSLSHRVVSSCHHCGMVIICCGCGCGQSLLLSVICCLKR